MPGFIIAGYVWHPWAVPKRPILNRVKIVDKANSKPYMWIGKHSSMVKSFRSHFFTIIFLSCFFSFFFHLLLLWLLTLIVRILYFLLNRSLLLHRITTYPVKRFYNNFLNNMCLRRLSWFIQILLNSNYN